MNFRFIKKVISIPVFTTILFVGGFGISNINNNDKYINNLSIDTEINSDLVKGQKVININLGRFHSGALTNQGDVYTWGSNNSGQLGDGTTEQKNIPTNITNNFKFSKNDQNEQIIQLEIGVSHSAALTNQGNVYTWGNNDKGQLGDGTSKYKLVPTNITNQFPFNEVDEKIIQLDLGENSTFALTDKGNVYSWGFNHLGQLGDGTTEDKWVPTKITNEFLPIDGKIIQLSIGTFHSSALTSKGNVYTWGRNGSGQLGDGTTDHKYTPTNITINFKLFEEDEQITQLSMGTYHSSALTNKGNVYTWGLNKEGQLGDGTSKDKLVPTNITDLFQLSDSEQIKQIDMGTSHSSALTDEDVYTWGKNNYGQLGNNSTSNEHSPIKITDKFQLDLDEKEQFTQSSIAESHSSALTNKGNVYTWGDNSFGQLGHSLEENKTPGKIIFSSRISKSNVKNITTNSATIDFDLTILNNEGPESKVTILDGNKEIFSKLYTSPGNYSIDLNNLKSNEEYNLSIFVDNWFQESIESFKTPRYISEDIEKDVDIKIKDKRNIKDLDNKITLIYSHQLSLKGTAHHLITYKDDTKQKIDISPDNKYSVNFEQTYNLDQSIINIKQTETFYEIDGYRVLLESHSGTKDKIFDHLKSKNGLSVSAIMGIVFSVMAGIVLIAALIIYFFKKNDKDNKLKTRLIIRK